MKRRHLSLRWLQEDLNFLLTNRLPRRAATLFMGWLSKVEQPLVKSLLIGLWRLFCPVDLSDAETQHFPSLHAAFIRRLKAGARPLCHDADVLVSPCDGIIGAHGRINDDTLFQAKGFPYTLSDLLPAPHLVEQFRNGSYLTIRITAGMYHRFHAPAECRIRRVTYISGDTWNVNPIALQRIERLFCKNERAVLEAQLERAGGQTLPFLMVPVAAILVASIRLHCIAARFHLRYNGPQVLDCDAHYDKGDELGWFEHGSTIILFFPAQATPLCFAENIRDGTAIRMGQALLRLK